MVKTRLMRSGRSRHPGSPPRPPRFTQRELWETLEPPVEVADAIRTLAALRERFEQALSLDLDRG